MPYTADDVRSKLPTAAAATAETFGDANYVKFYEHEPQQRDDGSETWYARAQNFVVEYTNVFSEASLRRVGEPEEYVVLIMDDGLSATVTAGDESVDVSGKTLVVVPPGDSLVEVKGSGRVARLVRSTATDLADLAINASSYEEPHPNIPEFVPWPDPPAGFRIRAYDLNVPPLSNPPFRLFRCTTFMVNFIDAVQGPRDLHKLSPHSHEDFEQVSLVIDGEYVHHLRWPWTPDRSTWRDDDHEFCASPHVAVIPAQSIHTSEAVSAGRNHLIDLFSPPREDFSAMEGWVLNADDYPTPKGA